MVSRQFVCLLYLSVGLSLVCAGDFNEDVIAISDAADSQPTFFENTVGFDLHKDIFYYQDEPVRNEYKRAKYTATQITLAGMLPDPTGRDVPKAVNPFAVAQRAANKNGALMDRWDVKDNGVDAQYFALYQGEGRDFVVNKLRAHLLRRLANVAQDFLPLLDRTAEPDALEHEKQVHKIHDDTREAIEQVFRELDDEIRESMSESDNSRASATVAIVSKKHVITANLGGGRVLAYDSSFEVVDLTSGQDDKGLLNLFGARRDRPNGSAVHVDIVPREMDSGAKLQLLMLQTPRVAGNMRQMLKQTNGNDQEAFSQVLHSIAKHRNIASHEQEMFSSAISGIIDSVSGQIGALKKMFGQEDLSMMLIGLERDYDEIH